MNVSCNLTIEFHSMGRWPWLMMGRRLSAVIVISYPIGTEFDQTEVGVLIK